MPDGEQPSYRMQLPQIKSHRTVMQEKHEILPISSEDSQQQLSAT